MIFIMIRRHQGLYFNGPLSPVKSKMACDHCNGKKVSVIFCMEGFLCLVELFLPVTPQRQH